ncbi:hypothetical protein D3C87_646000 [compost metagenome]
MALIAKDLGQEAQGVAVVRSEAQRAVGVGEGGVELARVVVKGGDRMVGFQASRLELEHFLPPGRGRGSGACLDEAPQASQGLVPDLGGIGSLEQALEHDPGIAGFPFRQGHLGEARHRRGIAPAHADGFPEEGARLLGFSVDQGELGLDEHPVEALPGFLAAREGLTGILVATRFEVLPAEPEGCIGIRRLQRRELLVAEGGFVLASCFHRSPGQFAQGLEVLRIDREKFFPPRECDLAVVALRHPLEAGPREVECFRMLGILLQHLAQGFPGLLVVVAADGLLRRVDELGDLVMRDLEEPLTPRQ